MNYVGIDIGGTNLKAGLVDDSGNLLSTAKMKMSNLTDPDYMALTLHRLVEQLCDESDVPLSAVGSVGVGIPGTVEIRGGSIVYSCNLPWRGVPLRRLFHQYNKLPLYIENDANCAALGEYYAGAGRGTKRFITITLGTGIGAGIIHNSKISHGSNGMAGEVGHMVVQRDGEFCPCGRKGCWEQYASATALKRITKKYLEAAPHSILAEVVAENGGKVSGRSAFIAARMGCPVGQAACDEYIGWLALGIANVINIYQPDALAVGGGVSNEEDESLLFPLQKQVFEQSLPCPPEKRTRVVKAELGNKAGLIGAALLGKKKRI